MTSVSYQYDGSWEGLLTVIFEAFDRKERPVAIFSKEGKFFRLFESVRLISTDHQRAQRVAKGVIKRSKLTYKRMGRIFLSEHEDREQLCYELSRVLFKNTEQAESDYGNPYVLRAKQIEKEMSREVHRMHAFVRFQKAQDNTWYAFIKPDFDVLPLIGGHFERRYADQSWVIYDLKRKYGIFYDLNTVDFIQIDFEDKIKDGKLPEGSLHQTELDYQNLWKKYFQHVNIKERKNMRLHLQHIPKRYWGLMTEKN